MKDPGDDEDPKGKKKKKKKSKKPPPPDTGIDVEMIFQDTRNDSVFIEQGNDFPPAPSDVINLCAGVKIEERGKIIEGPNAD